MKYKHLSEQQRYELKAFLQCGKSQRFISIELGVSEATISRELKRNSTNKRVYSAKFAQESADIRKERFCYNRKFTNEVQRFIDEKLMQEQWSPEQIVGYCKIHNIAMVCKERIYRYIRKNKKEGGKLYLHLRHQLKHRKRSLSGKHEAIKNKKSIELRPEIVETNTEFGHYEIDLIVGPENKGAVLTIVERKTKQLIMEKLRGKKASELANSLVNALLPFKKHIKTITSDNGTEFAEHQYISRKLNCDFYFAHPYSSWERGLNENTNGLIRQYIPKGTDLKNINAKFIKEIQYKINRRPRKTLNFEKPVNLFYNLAK
jgi:IS30 family transposase